MRISDWSSDVCSSDLVILDVARALDTLGVRRVTGEFREDRAVRLAHHVRKNVQPAAMRHADDDFLDPELHAAFENLLDGLVRGLAAFEAEALGAGVLLVEILLADLRLNHALGHGGPPEFRKIGQVADALAAP